MTTDKEQRALLENFVIANKDLEELEAKISRFNLFEAVGMVRQFSKLQLSSNIRFEKVLI